VFLSLELRSAAIVNTFTVQSILCRPLHTPLTLLSSTQPLHTPSTLFKSSTQPLHTPSTLLKSTIQPLHTPSTLFKSSTQPLHTPSTLLKLNTAFTHSLNLAQAQHSLYTFPEPCSSSTQPLHSPSTLFKLNTAFTHSLNIVWAQHSLVDWTMWQTGIYHQVHSLIWWQNELTTTITTKVNKLWHYYLWKLRHSDDTIVLSWYQISIKNKVIIFT